MHPAHQPEAAPTWSDVQALIRAALGDGAFNRWLAPTTGVVDRTADGTSELRLTAPNIFSRDWIRREYGSVIATVWRQVAPQGHLVITAAPEPLPTPIPPREPVPAKVIQFPLFPAEARPASNNMARSALFSCVQGKDRQMVKDALLASQDGLEIRFTGERLNQDDHDLLMQLVHMGGHKPLGEYITVPAYAILTALGRNTGGYEHKQLRADIMRLMACVVSLSTAEFEYLGHLIEDAAQDKTSRYWTFKFNPKLRPLYDDNAYTLIDWDQRKKLKGKDLARWLHLYLASHAAPFPVSVAYLHELSGSQSKTLFHFRAKLRLALEALEKNKDIEDWHIDKLTDLVHINRGAAITDSQQRSLTRPKRGRKLKK